MNFLFRVMVVTILTVPNFIKDVQSQVESILDENKFSSCNTKCYLIYKKYETIDSIFNQEQKIEIDNLCKLYLKSVFDKEIVISSKEDIDSIKNCNATLIILSFESIIKHPTKIGQKVGVINTKFYQYKNANSVKPDTTYDIMTAGESVWGDSNSFQISLRNALREYIDLARPDKPRIRPIKKEQ